jgi:uncharacterized membrane protein YfcA
VEARIFLQPLPDSGSVIAYLVLLLVAALGGAANALAGGGTFLVFPALLFAGVAPVTANVTSSLVLLPGIIASAWVYRDTMGGMTPSFLSSMSIASLAGSLAGSFLLMRHLVPWLLLGAAAIFSAAPRIRGMVESRRFAQAKTGGHPSCLRFSPANSPSRPMADISEPEWAC